MVDPAVPVVMLFNSSTSLKIRFTQASMWATNIAQVTVELVQYDDPRYDPALRVLRCRYCHFLLWIYVIFVIWPFDHTTLCFLILSLNVESSVTLWYSYLNCLWHCDFIFDTVTLKCSWPCNLDPELFVTFYLELWPCVLDIWPSILKYSWPRDLGLWTFTTELFLTLLLCHLRFWPTTIRFLWP